MTNRSRTDIISDILKAANGGGARRTKIMFHAYLSYVQLKDYLIVLTQNGLLSYELDTRTFKTTGKGLRFLDAYKQMDGMVKAPAQPLYHNSRHRSGGSSTSTSNRVEKV